MPSRRWLWVRPTPHIYSYNRELSTSSSSAATASSAAAEAIANARSIRASSEVNNRSASSTIYNRATSVAPGTSLTGYTGYYGRQLALSRQAEQEKQAVKSAIAATSASKVTAAASSSTAASVQASVSKQTTKIEAVKTTVQQEESHIEQRRLQMLKMQEQSIREGRQSVSRAVRRAEQFAESSGRDPRHVYVPRDTTDDINYKIADLHIQPYDRQELGVAKSAVAQGKLKIDRMEKELAAITSSAMKFQSSYTKSAKQMAKEAMEASQSEATASKKTRKTVVEEVKRVAAA